MYVFVVISKKTGHIMAIYSSYTKASKAWITLENEYSIMEFPLL